jgi:hypothetical protein
MAHPNVVTVYEVGIHQGHLFIFMDASASGDGSESGCAAWRGPQRLERVGGIGSASPVHDAGKFGHQEIGKCSHRGKL